MKHIHTYKALNEEETGGEMIKGVSADVKKKAGEILAELGQGWSVKRDGIYFVSFKKNEKGVDINFTTNLKDAGYTLQSHFIHKEIENDEEEGRVAEVKRLFAFHKEKKFDTAKALVEYVVPKIEAGMKHFRDK